MELYYPEGSQFGKEKAKNWIYKKFIGDENLLSYLPDNPDVKSISRELLLDILFFANRDKYLSLYEEYKDLQIQRTTTGNKKYIANLTEEMLAHLRNFKPVNM